MKVLRYYLLFVLWAFIGALTYFNFDYLMPVMTNKGLFVACLWCFIMVNNACLAVAAWNITREKG